MTINKQLNKVAETGIQFEWDEHSFEDDQGLIIEHMAESLGYTLRIFDYGYHGINWEVWYNDDIIRDGNSYHKREEEFESSKKSAIDLCKELCEEHANEHYFTQIQIEE